MSTLELARRRDLCQELNMNLDEANELFSTETLSNMKMAQVNGGNPIFGVLGVISAVITIGTFIYTCVVDTSKPIPTKTAGNGLSFGANGELVFTNVHGETMPVDSIKYNGNGYTQIWTKPTSTTPAPTLPQFFPY